MLIWGMSPAMITNRLFEIDCHQKRRLNPQSEGAGGAVVEVDGIGLSGNFGAESGACRRRSSWSSRATLLS